MKPSSPDNPADELPVALSLAQRGSTPRLIANALRAAIVDGTLAPGAPLRQDPVARHFSVSAIPVREALRQLESEGWVKVEMNKGATVAPLSAEEAREIYEIRAALESLAIGLAIPAHTPASLRHAEALCKAASAETDPSLYVSRNKAFHLSLYEPAARPQLFELIAVLHGRGERYLRLKFGLPSYKAASDREHAALLNAVRTGDVAQAQSLVTKHLLDTGELLHRFLCQDAEAAAAAPPETHAR
jgi:DNA-binding GntR family transcriptional regulator